VSAINTEDDVRLGARLMTVNTEDDGPLTIKSIVPAEGWWAVYTPTDRDPGGPPPPSYLERIAVWAVVENEEGRAAVRGMREADCGYLDFVDYPNFEGLWHKGDSECRCGRVPDTDYSDPLWCGKCWGVIAA
jgi:hypothetical protein